MGLEAYSEAYTDVFFGRMGDRQMLIGNLRASRFTVLYAQSGVGKSSLLRAGVVPRLHQLAGAKRRKASQYVPAICSSWEGDAMAKVTASIVEGVDEFLSEGDRISAPEGRLDDVVEAVTREHGVRLLVILDQFEEYFVHQRDPASREAFAEAVARCVNRTDLDANFLVSIREDAYASLGSLFQGRIPNVFGNYLHLAPLGRAGGEDAIRRPLEKFGVVPHDDLVDAVLDAVMVDATPDGAASGATSNGDGGAFVATPYLQLVMKRIWERETVGGARPRELLPDVLGDAGTERIIQSHVEDAIAELKGQRAKDIAAAALGFLAPSDRGKLTLTLDQLAGWTPYSKDEIKAVLDPLDEARVVATVGPESYEIFHDVLLRYVVGWRQEHEKAQLEKVKEREREKRREAEEEARRQTALKRRARRLAKVAAVVMVFALGAAVVAVIFAFQVQHEKATSASRRLVSSARDNPDLGLASLFALEAHLLSPTPATRDAIFALADNRQLGAPLATKTGAFTSLAFSADGKTLAAGRDDNTIRVWDAASHRLLKRLDGPTERINGVAFAPDRTLAAGSDDGLVRLWGPTWQRRAAIVRHKGAVGDVAFNSTGTALAVGYGGIPDPDTGLSPRGSIEIFDPKRPTRPPITLAGRTGPVAAVAFNPKRRMLASSSCEPRLHQETGDHAVRLWDLKRRRQVAVLRGHSAPVCGLAFSPDGTRLASAGDDQTVVLWDVAHRRELGTPFVGHTDVVNAVSFSRDGQTIATSSRDHTVRLWDIDRHLQVAAPLANHTSGVSDVKFGPGGTTLASAGSDSTVRLWSAASPREHGPPIRNASPHWALSIAWSPDGSKIAWFGDNISGHPTHRLYVRDVMTGATRSIVTKTGNVNGLAFSPDSGSVAWAATEDRTIRLWDLAMAKEGVLTTVGKQGDVTKALAFSSDGTIAYGFTRQPSGKSTIELRDWIHNKPIGSLGTTKSEIHGLAFNRDGTQLVSGGDDQELHLWDVAGRRQIGPPFKGHTGTVLGVAFDPHGHTVASGGTDQTVRLWNVQTHREIGSPVARHLGGVYSVAFSPDGKMLASGSGDLTIRLWDVASRLSVSRPLSGHTGFVFGVAFSPTGKLLASAGGDGTIRLWNNYSVDAAIGRLCHYVDLRTARRELKLVEPDIEYRRPC